MKLMRYCQMPTIEVTTPILSRLALLDMCLEIADMAAGFGGEARAPGKAGVAQRLTHGAAAGAIARCIDIGFGHGACVGAAAEETAEMTFLVAPCGDFDRAVDAGIAVDDARGFQRIDHAERPIEPACMVLAFEMRAR